MSHPAPFIVLTIVTLYTVQMAYGGVVAMPKWRRLELASSCDEMIPQFISHIQTLSQGTNVGCGAEIGSFPRPGDCQSYFKCVRGHSGPLLEYCPPGTTFNGLNCMRNGNLSDCPQFNCKFFDSRFERVVQSAAQVEENAEVPNNSSPVGHSSESWILVLLSILTCLLFSTN